MSLPAEQNFPDIEVVEPLPEAMSDNHIIQQVIAGKVALFELILRRYNQRLFRVARSIIGDDAEAEDIVQETYVRAFKNLRQFRGESLFSTWLTKIAVHEASLRRRKRQRLFLLGPGGDSEIDAMPIPYSRSDSFDEASRLELQQLLSHAVDALPDDLRTVFTMRMVEGLNTAETAECLELTPANVKVRLHRARLELRSWIDQHIGEESRELYMCAGARCDRIVATVAQRLGTQGYPPHGTPPSRF